MVSTRIQSSTTKGTHFLDMEVRISPDTDRKQACQVCLLPGEDGGRGLLRHGKKLNNQKASLPGEDTDPSQV